MELIDLYDNNRCNTGEVWERGKPLENGKFRLVIHVCIFNGLGQMLIQKRSDTKNTMPGLWDFSTGGCAQAGETSKDSAKRELFEELGINHDFSNERPAITINFKDGYDDIYVINDKIELSDVKFVDGEVQEVKWATLDEIYDMIDNATFIKYKKEAMALIFKLAESKGARADE